VPRDPTFYLRIANTGRTAAQHLRLTLDRAFHRYARQQEGENLASFHAFAEEIQSFGPGEELLFALAQDFEIFGEKADRSRVPLLFSVTAQYGYGTKRVSESATIDLRPYLKSQIKPDALVAEVRQLREKAEKIGQELRTLVSRLAERGQ
jgi:vacuolar-type H+-ATPase subunit I/STV1